MPLSRFSNYLRAHRKRLLLTQDEMAFLLGAESGTKVSRYEKFARTPNFRTALAYQVICRKPMDELFSGLYREIESEVSERAKILVSRNGGENTSRQSTYKRQFLQSLAGIDSEPQ